MFFSNYFLKFGHPSSPNGFLMIWWLCIGYRCVRKRVSGFFQPWMFSFLPLVLLNDMLLHAYGKGRVQESGCAEKGRGSGHETRRRSGWDLEGFSFMAGS